MSKSPFNYLKFGRDGRILNKSVNGELVVETKMPQSLMPRINVKLRLGQEIQDIVTHP